MKIFRLFLMSIVLISGQHILAQDGQALFKAKCNTCHALGKNSTGPDLKGVKQKWEDGGEGNLIYDWVKNSTALIASGRSKMATEASSFSPTAMANQDVSNEEIDAILSFVDSYEPPVAKTAEGGKVENVVTKPDYERNLRIFYVLITLSFVLVLVIIIISNSTKMLMESTFYKKKLVESFKSTEGGDKILPMALLVALIGFSNNTFALTFQPNAEDGMPWIQVENIDLIILFWFNVVLACVVLYMKSIFNNLLKNASIEVKKGRFFKKKEQGTVASINTLLNDFVPIEKEEQILMEHDYDGIRELDNNLPPWWLVMFFLTIVFSVGYLFHYHVFKTGDLQLAEYEKSVKKADYEVKEYLSKMAMNVDENNVTLLTEASDLATGKSLFSANCVTCHKQDGEGDIGPNLTDKNWIIGYDIKDVFKTIKYGTANGMPEHQSKFNPIQLQQVGSYVLSLPSKEGKPAEGNIIKE